MNMGSVCDTEWGPCCTEPSAVTAREVTGLIHTRVPWDSVVKSHYLEHQSSLKVALTSWDKGDLLQF